MSLLITLSCRNSRRYCKWGRERKNGSSHYSDKQCVYAWIKLFKVMAWMFPWRWSKKISNFKELSSSLFTKWKCCSWKKKNPQALMWDVKQNYLCLSATWIPTNLTFLWRVSLCRAKVILKVFSLRAKKGRKRWSQNIKCIEENTINSKITLNV